MPDHRRQSSVHSKPQPVPTQSPRSRQDQSPSAHSHSRATPTTKQDSPAPSQNHGSPAVRQIPTPGQLASRQSPGAQTPLSGLGPQKSSPLELGESALANALRGSFGGSPPCFDTPPLRPLSPANAPEGRGPRSNYGSFEPRPGGSPAPYEDHEVIRRHLAGPSNNSSSNVAAQSDDRSTKRSEGQGREGVTQLDGSGPAAPDLIDDEFSSLRLQGGDVTRQIYRWTERREAEAQERGRTRRSLSYHFDRPRPGDERLDIHSIRQPGGFRRDHLRRTAGTPSPAGAGHGVNRTAPSSQWGWRPFTSNTLEFISLYGHFAGERLDEDDEDEADEYFSSDAYGDEEPEDDESWGEGRQPGETSALLTPSAKKRRKGLAKVATGSQSNAAFLLLKSFVGTGVLFLPRAFLNGGMLFSSLVLLFVSVLSFYCFILLINTRLKHQASYGEMGAALYGRWLSRLINGSLIISQVGFASAYIVFTSENLQAFILAVSKCRTYIPIGYIILMQMVIFLPFSLLRKINAFKGAALVAELFIVVGLIVLYYYDVSAIVSAGLADIALFNRNDWTLFIGTAIFTFEGIGLIIPIQEGMKDPSKLPRVLGLVMVIITVVFTSMGALSYAAFGSATKTVIISNLPQDNKVVNAVQFLYSLAIMLSTPLQIHPAIDILSLKIWERSGKNDLRLKWKKNIFRFGMVVLCALIAWVGANDLDKFVALVGSFACVPLVYIYPVSKHLSS